MCPERTDSGGGVQGAEGCAPCVLTVHAPRTRGQAEAGCAASDGEHGSFSARWTPARLRAPAPRGSPESQLDSSSLALPCTDVCRAPSCFSFKSGSLFSCGCRFRGRL